MTEHDQPPAAGPPASRVRIIVVFVVALLVIGGGAAIVASQRGAQSPGAAGSPSPTRASSDALPVSPVPEPASGSCSAVETVGPYQPQSEDTAHTGLAPLADYPSIPPVSGPHSDGTVPAGVYDESVDLGAAIHTLEHGGVVIWFDPSVASDAQLVAIGDLVSGNPANADHTVIAPFDYQDLGPDGRLPAGTTVAITAWHHLVTCTQPDLAAARAFLSSYRYPPLDDGDYLGDAPEPGAPI